MYLTGVMDPCTKSVFLFSLPVLPGLVLSLHSAHQDVRIGAVHCLQKVNKICRLSEGLQHGDSLKKLLKRKQIVMVDHEYASAVIYIPAHFWSFFMNMHFRGLLLVFMDEYASGLIYILVNCWSLYGEF